MTICAASSSSDPKRRSISPSLGVFELHRIPVEAVAVHLGEVDGEGDAFPLAQRKRQIERDAVFNEPQRLLQRWARG
jgi:hypothetical protein